MSGAPYRLTKRFLDVLGGTIGLVLFLVLFPFIGLAIVLNSRGPILVKLDRVSQGKTIKLYKFRSMTEDAASRKSEFAHLNERTDGPFFKIKNDPRLTRVGKVIRKFRFDEVPQFINVLSGELSLVGPRPHEPAEVAAYPAEFVFLSKEKAGITGLSQVNGASSLPFLKELELDSGYVRNQSLGMDLKIIGKTVAILLFDPTAV